MGKIDPVRICCAADDKYSLGLCVTLYSLIEHLSQSSAAVISILDCGIRPRNKKRIAASLADVIGKRPIGIEWIKVTGRNYDKAPIRHYYSKAIYPIFELPNLLSAKAKRVIFLDADLLLIDDLTKMWRMRVDNQAALAMRAPCYSTMHWHPNIEKLREFGVNSRTKYFNMGVMLINLEYWRKKKVAKKAWQLLAKRDLWHLPSQDVLNVLLAGQWSELHARWNWVPDMDPRAWEYDAEFLRKQYEEASSAPSILHYLYKPKPWEKKCAYSRTYKDLYRRYIRRTRFADHKLKKSDWKG